MPIDLSIPAASESLLGHELLVPLGGIAALFAMLGMVLLLPIFINQRREVARLLAWKNQDPEAGTREFRALPAAGAAVTSGRSTAADRVTSERPALARVGTAEQRAIELEQAPWWRRVIERGPRHPLVISLIAIVAGVAIVFAVAHFLRAGDEGGNGAPIAPGTVSVVVLNASTSAGLAGDLSNQLSAGSFDVAGTSVANDETSKSVVKYSPDNKRQARAVAKALGISDIEPFDKEAEAAANGADVVVVAGDDVGKAAGGSG
jgi:hypothetical protein